jgi:hypothetical protein
MPRQKALKEAEKKEVRAVSRGEEKSREGGRHPLKGPKDLLVAEDAVQAV